MRGWPQTRIATSPSSASPPGATSPATGAAGRSASDAGDAAREMLPEAVQLSHDRLCAVGSTVEAATPIATASTPDAHATDPL